MITLTEISRDTYGHDERAINKHAERCYQDTCGNRYVLSRTLDGIPPFFDAYGPFATGHAGLLPCLKVHGQDYWGEGLSWRKAEEAFCHELQAVIIPRRQMQNR